MKLALDCKSLMNGYISKQLITVAIIGEHKQRRDAGVHRRNSDLASGHVKSQSCWD